MNSKSSCDVAIIGAGISGLSLAYQLKKKGYSVTVLEKSSKTGGVIETIKEDGYVFEAGPNTIQESSTALLELANELSLNPIYSSETANNRYILTQKGLLKVPMGPKEALKTKLIPLCEKLHFALKEMMPSLVSKAPEKNESVYEFSVRNFGEKTYQNLIQPFLNGILAQDGHTTSAEALFKNMVLLEREKGSIFRAIKSKKGSKPKEKKTSVPRLVSFPEGLCELPEKLKDTLGNDLRFNSPVDMIFKQGELWHCSNKEGKNLASAKSVVLCTPSHISSRLLRSPELNKIQYTRLLVLGLGFHCKEISHPLNGFGFLAKKDAGYPFLGSIWSSSIFSRRAPKDHQLLNFFIGGESNPELLELDEKTLVNKCLKGLQKALDLNKTPQPSKIFCRKYEKAIPKFGMDHRHHIEELKNYEKSHPGLHFLGNFEGGVSLNDRITSSCELAEKFSI